MSDHSYQGSSGKWPIVLGIIVVLAIIGLFALSSGTAVNTGDPASMPVEATPAPAGDAATSPLLIPEPAPPADGG